MRIWPRSLCLLINGLLARLDVAAVAGILKFIPAFFNYTMLCFIVNSGDKGRFIGNNAATSSNGKWCLSSFSNAEKRDKYGILKEQPLSAFHVLLIWLAFIIYFPVNDLYFNSNISNKEKV